MKSMIVTTLDTPDVETVPSPKILEALKQAAEQAAADLVPDWTREVTIIVLVNP